MVLAAQKSALNNTLREQTLDAAKRHKASWIELGQYLQSIYKDKHYKEWGFMSFEAYCMKELGIKQATAAKLIKSYSFLEKEEPRFVDNRSAEEISPKIVPSYESVNLLRLAKENKNFTPHEYATIREAVIEEVREPKEVRAQLKKIIEEKEDKDPAEVKRTRRNGMIRRLVTTLSSARRELESDGALPGSLLKEIVALMEKLEKQIE